MAVLVRHKATKIAEWNQQTLLLISAQVTALLAVLQQLESVLSIHIQATSLLSLPSL